MALISQTAGAKRGFGLGSPFAPQATKTKKAKSPAKKQRTGDVALTPDLRLDNPHSPRIKREAFVHGALIATGRAAPTLNCSAMPIISNPIVNAMKYLVQSLMQ
jgi:hypothetical protein